MNESFEQLQSLHIFDTGKVWRASQYEPYGVRRFNPSNPEDTQSYSDIDRHQRGFKYTIPHRRLSRRELDKGIRVDESDKKDPKFRMAVVDKNNKPVGWIMYYLEDNVEELRRFIEIPDDTLALEVSYQKQFTDWPKGTHYVKSRNNLLDEQPLGVAVSGVRQTMQLLAEREVLITEQMRVPPRPILITAYSNPKNPASEKVLEKNGFTKLDHPFEESEAEVIFAWYKWAIPAL